MWYYVKDNRQKQGPISDPALAELLRDGEISPSTLVWTQHMKEWTPLKKTAFYFKLKAKRIDPKFVKFKWRTYFLRSTIAAIIVVNLLRIHQYLLTMAEFPYGLDSQPEKQRLDMILRYSENVSIISLLDTIVFGMTCAAIFLGALWIASAVRMTKKLTSQYTVSSKMAFLGCIFPVANIVLIPVITKQVYRFCERAVRHIRNIGSRIFIRTWNFLWFASWIALVFYMAVPHAPEIAEQIYQFSIFNAALQCLLMASTLVVISRVFKLATPKTH